MAIVIVAWAGWQNAVSNFTRGAPWDDTAIEKKSRVSCLSSSFKVYDACLQTGDRNNVDELST